MPELPEVEVICRGLAPQLVGRRFLKVIKGEMPLRQESSPAELKRWLEGRQILDLRRRGKYLLFHLEGGTTLLIHLGMTGRLLLSAQSSDPLPPSRLNSSGRDIAAPPSPSFHSVNEISTVRTLHEPALPLSSPGQGSIPPGGNRPSPPPPLSHVHVVFQLEGGLTLLFQDVRRFGQVLVYPPGEALASLAQVGREPFSRQVRPEWLLEKANGKSRPLKNFLLDGRIVTGIGNIYACEIMFASRLSPTVPVGRLSFEDWRKVLRETRRILKAAIGRGGTTVNDYLNSQGETGLFQLDLMVYGRAGEPCRKCGAAIERLTQAGRSTFFCPRCQKG